MTITPNLVIDDLRLFLNPDTPAQYARTSQDGIAALEALQDTGVKTLWLDHDLGLKPDGTEDSIMPVVDHLSYLAFQGTPFPVEMIRIQTDNPAGRRDIRVALERWGYRWQIVSASEVFYVPAAHN